ncbi:branched-chain amino acid ABC transporter permease [Streptomyces sp. NPDC088354]|uniref:branched-chain amino acid ABC transporter permease n=1 Tax=unclassified Streptomyces TaxID=2593676 RepID=UPI0029B600D0|nr:branched-chain amino acid ABC transporter permease [Streptomyces sp. MI02-7b]MDX3074336.1 branched-chain amino acid ABC transporter permease [Streptomyces sp. MI02-7b]
MSDTSAAQSFSVDVAKLRRKAWYQEPRWVRLLGMLVLGFVLALMTGEDGNPADKLSAFTGAFESARLWICLAIMAALWALMEFGAPVREAARQGTQGVTRSLEPARALFRSNGWLRLGGLVVVLVLAIVIPANTSLFWQEVLVTQMGIFMIIAVGLNVVVGWAGLLDLGFIAFYAIGAYSCAFWTGHMPVKPPFTVGALESIPFAIVTCLIAGVLLGAPTLRLRGDYLAIVTLGFHEIVYLVAKNSDGFTNGSRGVIGIPHPSIHIGPINYDWTLDPLPYWYLLLFFLVVLIFLYNRLEHSRIGRTWTAIREDEVAASATGINTVRYKLLAFAIGASTSGLAGVVYSSKVGFINPENFTIVLSVLALAYVVFGGMGSIAGVLFGAALLVWLPNALRDYVPEQDRFIYLGALLVIMMIFRPQGVIPSRRRQRELHMAEAGVGDADAMSEPVGGVQK